MAEDYAIKKSSVRERTNLNVGSDFYESLNDEVERLIDNAEERAEENGRRTLKARDA